MTQLGKYELHEQLGKGGFGTVYRATDTSLGREVAIKLLHPQLMVDEEFIHRFRKEAKILAAMDNNNIVTIYEMDEVDGRIFISMRYLSGKSLKDLIKDHGRIPFEKAFTILKQVANGLSDAHAKGLVHRDLKPENILFDSHGNAVITDFGLVKAATEGSSFSIDRVVGTPNYIAPEIWRGKSASNASDIYSIGCILYEMLTGEVLFKGDNVADVMTKHVLDGPKIKNGLSEHLLEVLQKVLTKDPSNRYQSINDLVSALENEKPLTPPLPLPPPPPPPPPTNTKKNNRLLIFGGIALMLIAASLFISKCFLFDRCFDLNFEKQTKATNTATNLSVNETTNTTPVIINQGEEESYAIETQVSKKDGMTMVHIPGGTFSMGTNIISGEDERPVHVVFLNNYWFDQSEVTNGMYKKCIAEGVCTQPNDYGSNEHADYFENPSFNDYPVINVDWGQALNYCKWAGRQLPTEAQWEKAARSINEWVYPWGDAEPGKNMANYDMRVGDTTAVGSFPEGASNYGVVDMAGNVWEWVADWYGEYPSGYVTDPTGPSSGSLRVLRGGSWSDNEDIIRSTNRHSMKSSLSNNNTGFRCSCPYQ